MREKTKGGKRRKREEEGKMVGEGKEGKYGEGGMRERGMEGKENSGGKVGVKTGSDIPCYPRWDWG